MKGYCKGCGVLLDETEVNNHKCKIWDFNQETTIKHDGIITRRRKVAK